MPGVGFEMESANAMVTESINNNIHNKASSSAPAAGTTVVIGAVAVSPTNTIASAGAGGGVEDSVKQHALRPLEDLSEADIRQLTREDCRRYLKERGMRRPSWNKAQAIQQVLSLKGLMCSSSSSSSKVAKTPLHELERGTATPPLLPRTKELLDKVGPPPRPPSSNDSNNSSPSEMPTPPVTTTPFEAPGATAQHSLHGSAPGGTHRAQLTIFYSGVVNVYNDVPLEKAQAIMLLASSKTFHVPNPLPSTTVMQTPQGEPVPLPVNRGYVSPFLSPSPDPAPAPVNNAHDESTDYGLPQARTVSLQRFLAKRRERISANPSYYRRGEKQSSKRNKSTSSSSPSPPPPPPPAAPPPPPQTPLQLATTGSPLLSTNFTHAHRLHSLTSCTTSNLSNRSRSSASSDDTSGGSATTTTFTGGGGGNLNYSYYSSMETLPAPHATNK